MKCRAVAFSVLTAFAALVCPGATSQSQKDHGDALIVGIIGEWKIEGQDHSLRFLSPIEVGNGICADGTEGYLAVQFGDKVSPFVCNRDRPTDDGCNPRPARKDKPFLCARHIARPPDPGVGVGMWQGFAAAVFPLFHSSPERFVAPVSRGLEAELSDAVVQLRGGSVDFASVFADLDPGSYTVRMAPLDGFGKTQVSAAVNWKGSGTGSATVAGLTSGLYRAVRVETNGTPTGQDAWVLVCSPERFEKQSAEFSKAVEATKKWPTEVDARAPRAVLRAYLQALSSEP
jgi:hypothetical protein